MRFTTIGYIEWRKGQDILIDALEGIRTEILAEHEFLLVGQDSSVLAQKLREQMPEKPWIRLNQRVGTFFRRYWKLRMC